MLAVPVRTCEIPYIEGSCSSLVQSPYRLVHLPPLLFAGKAHKDHLFLSVMHRQGAAPHSEMWVPMDGQPPHHGLRVRIIICAPRRKINTLPCRGKAHLSTFKVPCRSKLIVVHVMDDSVWWSQGDFDRNHRNMTITAETLDLKIRHRFTGHSDLGENGLGVETLGLT